MAILRVLMDTLPDHIYFKDLRSRFVRNNAAHAAALGASSPEACIGKTDHDFFAREHADNALADEQAVIRTGQPVIGRVEQATLLDGKRFWASTTKMPWRDSAGRLIGTFGITRDITVLKEAESQLRSERNLLRTIIDHLPARIFVKDLASRYVLNNQAHLENLGLKHQQDAAGHTTLHFHPGDRGRQALADDHQVLHGGPPILNQEKSDFGELGNVRWSLTTKVPLRDADGRITGLVGISHDITRRKLAEEALQRHAAEVEADLRMARQVQETFLPRTYPVFPRGVPADASALRFAHRYIPATTLGGDFFHVLQLSDSQCGILVCDVMGHGVRAGLLTALIRGVVEEMDDRAADPTRVLAEINRSLAPILALTGEPVFATVFFGVIDTAAAMLCYASAGHPPPLVRRGATGQVEALKLPSPEPACGLIDPFPYSSHRTDLAAGDLLLGYTDGLFEATNAAGEMFGEARMSAMIQGAPALPAADLIHELVREVMTFTGRQEFEDDICVVAVESTGSLCALRPGLTYEI